MFKIFKRKGNHHLKNINPKEAFELIKKKENNPDFIILDVRTPKEYADAHIEGAENLDYRSKSFSQDLEKMDKNATYLVYCRSGRRGNASAKIMEKLGYKKVYNLSGGIMKWKRLSLPL